MSDLNYASENALSVAVRGSECVFVNLPRRASGDATSYDRIAGPRSMRRVNCR